MLPDGLPVAVGEGRHIEGAVVCVDAPQLLPEVQKLLVHRGLHQVVQLGARLVLPIEGQDVPLEQLHQRIAPAHDGLGEELHRHLRDEMGEFFEVDLEVPAVGRHPHVLQVFEEVVQVGLRGLVIEDLCVPHKLQEAHGPHEHPPAVVLEAVGHEHVVDSLLHVPPGPPPKAAHVPSREGQAVPAQLCARAARGKVVAVREHVALHAPIVQVVLGARPLPCDVLAIHRGRRRGPGRRCRAC
mmetsp:Transcript_44690/g.142319  ORF Transcript_44690/g.142319 Transcript_44690/m.142319 type:complete len:241 (-) Transcript_44690:274-996(-)